MAESKDSGIGGAILALLFGAVLTGGWIAINGMILLERLLFTSSFLSPLFSWTIGGAICGSIAVSGGIVRNWKQSVRFNISLGVAIVLILLLATVNLKRTENYIAAAKSVSVSLPVTVSPPVDVPPPVAVPTPAATDVPEKKMPDKPSSDMSNESATLSNQLSSLAGGYAVVVTRTANVRENRSVKASSEYYLDKNERVYVISENGEWSRVRFPFEGKQIEGWVYRKLLAKDKER